MLIPNKPSVKVNQIIYYAARGGKKLTQNGGIFFILSKYLIFQLQLVIRVKKIWIRGKNMILFPSCQDIFSSLNMSVTKTACLERKKYGHRGGKNIIFFPPAEYFS
jgi:hypothetical protein